MTGDLGGRRLRSARRNAPAARARNHCRIRPAARKGRVLRWEVKDSAAFPWDEAPRYLIRDRDTSYGAAVTRRLQAMGIRDRPITPRSPWQNGHVERLIGSIRRECLDHVVVLGEKHLRHLLANYATYYNGVGCARTLRPTRMLRSIDLRRQSGLSHQSLGSAVSIGTTFG